MSPLATSCIALALIFAGTFLGMLLRTRLPEHHLNNDAKDVVRLGVSLVATIAALVLGLLIASAKSSYDTQSSQITRMTANLILLDRILAQYGPDAAPARDLLRRSVAPMVERIWRENGSDSAQAAPFEPNAASEAVYGELQELSPRNDAERSLQARAIQIGTELAQTRLLLFTETGNSIPRPFLVILVFWLTIIFASFSLFARPNLTVIAALFLFAWTMPSGAVSLGGGAQTPSKGTSVLQVVGAGGP